MIGDEPLDAAGRARVEAAVRAAEAGTRGEIVVVVARRASGYRSAPLLLAMLAALALPLPLLWFPGGPLANMSAERLYAAQLALALGLAALCSLPSRRHRLVPGFARRARAREGAAREFLARGVDRTAGRTGVLIYLALAERYAEVRCDAGLGALADPAEWRALVDDLTASASAGRLAEGLEAAVARAGAVLARHAPGLPGDRDELPNRVIVT